MLLDPRRGDEGSDRDERTDHRGEASLRGAGTEEGGQESPSGKPVYPEDGWDACAGHAANARGPTDGNGGLLDASRHPPASGCAEVLCTCSTTSAPAKVAPTAAEHGKTLWHKCRFGHGWISHGYGAKYGGHDA